MKKNEQRLQTGINNLNRASGAAKGFGDTMAFGIHRLAAPITGATNAEEKDELGGYAVGTIAGLLTPSGIAKAGLTKGAPGAVRYIAQQRLAKSQQQLDASKKTINEMLSNPAIRSSIEKLNQQTTKAQQILRHGNFARNVENAGVRATQNIGNMSVLDKVRQVNPQVLSDLNQAQKGIQQGQRLQKAAPVADPALSQATAHTLGWLLGDYAKPKK